MKNIKNLDKILVVNALSYKKHRERAENILSEYDLDFEFMTRGDISLFSDELLDTYFTEDSKEDLSKGALSCTLNHFFCYEEIVKNKYEYTLIFEDDFYLLGDFISNINKVVDEAKTMDKEVPFIISIENTTLKFPNKKELKKDKYIYKASFGRAAGAYIINLKGAEKILEYLRENKCTRLIDWLHNDLVDEKQISMYWAHPPFIEQGSHNGKMSGSDFSTKRGSFIRIITWKLNKIYKYHILRHLKG